MPLYRTVSISVECVIMIGTLKTINNKNITLEILWSWFYLPTSSVQPPICTCPPGWGETFPAFWSGRFLWIWASCPRPAPLGTVYSPSPTFYDTGSHLWSRKRVKKRVGMMRRRKRSSCWHHWGVWHYRKRHPQCTEGCMCTPQPFSSVLPDFLLKPNFTPGPVGEATLRSKDERWKRCFSNFSSWPQPKVQLGVLKLVQETGSINEALNRCAAPLCRFVWANQHLWTSRGTSQGISICCEGHDAQHSPIVAS